MSLVYLDTSAALKLLVAEDGSDAMDAYVASTTDQLVSSMLLFTELHCAADRRAALDPASVNAVLDGVELVSLADSDLVMAGASLWGLQSADAIHLASAIRLQVDGILTFDAELGAAAERAGVPILHLK